MTKRFHSELYGPLRIEELLNLVAAVGNDARDVDAQVLKIYDWRHARGLAVIQLAFAPAAVAALAIVAKPSSVAVWIGAGLLLLVSVTVGLWRLRVMNRFDSEFALALRLGSALAPFHRELAAYVQGQPIGHASSQQSDSTAHVSAGQLLYSQLRHITLIEYLTEDSERDRVRETLQEAATL